MIDVYLYVAFAAGVIAGRLTARRSQWVEQATIAVVVALVFFLGVLLAGLTPIQLLGAIPLALTLLGLVLALTVGLTLVLPRRPPGVGSGKPPRPVGLAVAAALVLGDLAGHYAALPGPSGVTVTLYLLLGLVGFNLRFSWAALRTTGTPVVAAVVGSLVAAPAFAVASGFSLRAALATTLGFGFYSLAGPLVTTALGPAAGLVAFLTNFLRENLTMVTAPWLGRRLRGEGLAAMGGATAMDTTLYFVTAYGDAEAGSMALASGLMLTVLASLVIPVLLALP